MSYSSGQGGMIVVSSRWRLVWIFVLPCDRQTGVLDVGNGWGGQERGSLGSSEHRTIH